MIRAYARNYPLLSRIVLYVFCVVALVSFISSGIQLYFTFQLEKQHILSTLESLETSQIETLSNHLWNMDTEAMEIQLRGVLENPDIVYIEMTNEQDRKQSFGVLPANEGDLITRHYLLQRQLGADTVELGSVTFTATTANSRNRLFKTTFKALASQLVTLFVTCFAILFLFIRLLSRHINTIVHYTGTLRVGELDRPLRLSRLTN